MKVYGLYESAAVKIQTLKTAIEVRFLPLPLCLLLDAKLTSFFRRSSFSVRYSSSSRFVSSRPTPIFSLPFLFSSLTFVSLFACFVSFQSTTSSPLDDLGTREEEEEEEFRRWVGRTWERETISSPRDKQSEKETKNQG